MKLFAGGVRPRSIGIAVGVIVAMVTLLGALELVELKSLDLRFRLRGALPPSSSIVIIAVDEDSFDELHPLAWPFPRALHAQLLDVVSQGRPAVVGLDVLFVEPSLRGDEDDGELAEAVKRSGNVVIASVFTETPGELYHRQSLKGPVEPVRAAAAAVGFVNLPTDEDAFVRSARLRRPYQDTAEPSFVAHLHAHALKAGMRARPLPPSAEMLINYRGPRGTFRRVPYYQVLRGEVSPEVFTGKIVLIGATSHALHDEYPTPYSGRDLMSGVEVQANLLETTLRGDALRRNPPYLPVALALAAGIAAALATSRMRPMRSFLLVVGLGSAYLLVAFAAFVGLQIWIDVVPFEAALVLAYGATVVANFVRERREKRRLSRFFSPDVITAILEAQTENALAVRRRHITVLFSDIRGFTTLTERLAPEEVAEILREFFTMTTEIVFKHGGTVDKYVGDAIMALYGAPFDHPDHAADAVRSALELQNQMGTLSERWLAKSGVTLQVGVGIHTGEAVVGTIGSDQRLEFTAVGDTVNLASRLEGLTKDFSRSIIISQTTCEMVKHLVHAQHLGEVRVKGKEVPVGVYAVERSEGRLTTRAAFEASVTVVDGDVAISASMVDVSRGGMAVRDLGKELEIDGVVGLLLDLPELAAPLSVSARTIRSEGSRASFAFFGLRDEDERLIEEIVRRHRPTAGS